ncbi:MAG: hypothetical protein DRQ10_08195 [Candidatus Hydrothermota bacterium]|nr:MAG: hypothetical protein DRQ10_08195 [Candidatus Hydrothermae bacterium]
MNSTKPFTGIAPYYDVLMQDVNYELWIDYVEELFKLFRVRPHKILDIGCGTGTPTIVLARRGYEVVGIDVSEDMLRIARDKTRTMPNVRFYLADVRRFNLENEAPFDAAISLFDSLNNILRENELFEAFRHVRAHLRPKAPFLFDMNTIYALEHYWGDKTRVREHEKIVSIWRTKFIKFKSLSQLHITLFVPEGDESQGLYRRIDEIHVEKGYPLIVLRRLLQKAGFHEVHIFQHLTRNPADEQVLRVMVAAR